MGVFLVFRCGDRLCALEREAVVEVAPLPELSAPPGMPATLEGFLNLGGEAVAVVDAAKLFGLGADADVDPIYRHILVMRDGSQLMGLLVDRVEDLRRFDDGSVRASGAGRSLNDCVRGEIDDGGPVIHVLASDRILMEAERVRLDDLRHLEQARLDALDAS